LAIGRVPRSLVHTGDAARAALGSAAGGRARAGAHARGARAGEAGSPQGPHDGGDIGILIVRISDDGASRVDSLRHTPPRMKTGNPSIHVAMPHSTQPLADCTESRSGRDLPVATTAACARVEIVGMEAGDGNEVVSCVIFPVAANEPEPGIAQTDLLSVPHRKRMSHAYVVSDAGVRELCIYYGTKEISFDEEHLFPFGEQLASQGSFVAGDATSWGPGYDWDELRPLLESLLAEGILQHGEQPDDPRGGGLVASPLPPASCTMPRSWSAADAESITRELGGRPVEIGNLEAILGVYRVAHPALDADDRQVGEANVYPPGLRLDRDTEWRVCQYSGSRYRDALPMNITALRAMIKHWRPMMAAILAIRAEVQSRLVRSRDSWTISDMHLLSCVVLSVPAYPLMQGGGTSPQRPVHPVLSSMFRVTDGVRMVTHEMMFLSPERTRLPDEPVTADELYGFCERNAVFISNNGVCAGPSAMIRDFLDTLFTGATSERTESVVHAPEVQRLVAQLPGAVDYAFLGLMSWSVVRSIWLEMSLVYKALRELLAALGDDSELCGKLRARLDDDWFKLDAAKIASDYERDVHLQVYVDTYEASRRALRSPVAAATLAAATAAVPEREVHDAAAARLRDLLTARFTGANFDTAPVIDRMVGLFVYLLREEQAVLATTAEIQAAINRLLDRPQPRRPLTVRDLRVTYAMYGDFVGQFPYLFDTLEDELGFRVEATTHAIEIVDRMASEA
jgi:hypothetical protein